MNVDRIFYDARSLHCEIDAADQTDPMGNQIVGARVCRSLRKAERRE
jgi:hypothetical protein